MTRTQNIEVAVAGQVVVFPRTDEFVTYRDLLCPATQALVDCGSQTMMDVAGKCFVDLDANIAWPTAKARYRLEHRKRPAV